MSCSLKGFKLVSCEEWKRVLTRMRDAENALLLKSSSVDKAKANKGEYLKLKGVKVKCET